MLYRHWCNECEEITGCDTLTTALEAGWRVQGPVLRQTYWLGNSRPVSVYRFRLERDGDKAMMVVLENPAVARVIQTGQFRVVQLNERKEPVAFRFPDRGSVAGRGPAAGARLL